MVAQFSFDVHSRDSDTAARTGLVRTPHGDIETPVFMPVGTRATVKGVFPSHLEDLGTQIILSNTYHLALRPGADVVEELGGLHAMMGWNHPVLTDSGGYQVFSLSRLVKLTDDGAVFRSHVDGALFDLSPERAVEIQEQLGADIIMCLDVCPAHDGKRSEIESAVRRTSLWANRCRASQKRSDVALFGIVQGGIDVELRARSAQELTELDFPGYGIGGLSVGETHEQMQEMLDATVPLLPDGKPHYLMGVGRPQDVIESVARGIDMFDCVLPTRNGRNATALTFDGPVKLRNAQHRTSLDPIEAGCDCPACMEFSKGYIRHLFHVEEMLGPMLVSLHNIRFMMRLMGEIRRAIRSGEFSRYRSDTLARLGP